MPSISVVSEASHPTGSNSANEPAVISSSCKMNPPPRVPHQVSADADIDASSKEERILALLERTGYSMVQNNGQRKYGGPPPDWVGPPPPRGSEIFVGKLPRDIMEDELVPVFERCGKIYELRHMMDFAGTNRGFAYVRYSKPEEANQAIRTLNNFEIRKGHYIGVMQSVDNCRLFVGGIPRNKTKEDVKIEMSKITDGIVDVILKPSAHDKTKNRGFAFVEYENHRAAAMARRKLVPGKMQLWGQLIAVDWAEPEQEVDDETMSRVRIIYLSNLMLRTNEEKIREEVNKIRYDSVERIKKIKDYAFVHFHRREDAEAVLIAIDGNDIDGSIITAEWAKPPDKSLLRYVKNVQKVGAGGLFGVSPNGGSLHQNIVAAATQLYNTSINPGSLSGSSGIMSVANTSNDVGLLGIGGPGSTGGIQSKRSGRGAAGLRGAGVRQAMANAMKSVASGSKYSKSPTMYDILPQMALLSTNPVAFPHAKTASQVLELYCAQFQWGPPFYQLQTTLSKDVNDNSKQLFLYRIAIPALSPQLGMFQPLQLAETPEEAKELSAQIALQRLGICFLPPAVMPQAVYPPPPPPVASSFASQLLSPQSLFSPGSFSPGSPITPLTSAGVSAAPAAWCYPTYFTFMQPPKAADTTIISEPGSCGTTGGSGSLTSPQSGISQVTTDVPPQSVAPIPAQPQSGRAGF